MDSAKNFGLNGPTWLTVVDWNNSNHRQSILASLVQGVYTLERDRQVNRQGPHALAPPWWQFFNFTLNHTLRDNHDLSIFGAVYQFNFPQSYTPGQRPPHYVVAFRGTIKETGNREQDFKLNLHCVMNNLKNCTRFEIGLEKACETALMAGPENVWLAGHSLGSSIALLVGRNMVKHNGSHLETYLFNPPFISPPIGCISHEKLRFRLRLAGSVVTAGLARFTGGDQKDNEDPESNTFAALSTWIPYLFLNPFDPICSEYIGYFKHREDMESIGAGKIGRIATQHSIGSIVGAVTGKVDSDAAHLIPSAYLTINSSPTRIFKKDHGLRQWWRQDLLFEYKDIQYK